MLVSLLVCTFTLFAQKQTTIQGRVMHADKLDLRYNLNGESYKVGVDKDGRYSIVLDLTDFAILELYPLRGYPSIQMDEKGSHLPVQGMSVYIEPGERVTVDFDLQQWPVARIKGQKVAKEWGKLYETYGPMRRMFYENTRAKKDYNRKVKPSPEEVKKMDEEAAALKQKYERQLKDFCDRHPDSYVSLMEVKRKVRETPAEELLADYNRLSQRMQDCTVGQEVKAMIMAKKNSAVGVVAPDFTGTDPEGKEVRLADYRGQYVLLDFWGSWCHACLYSHPHMLELYGKYHSRGLQFIHIASEYQKKIEEKKEKWLAAIREDQIGVFTHVLNTDENDIVKAYSIQAFPTKILLSPTGEILGRWEGEASELDQMLEKIFLK